MGRKKQAQLAAFLPSPAITCKRLPLAMSHADQVGMLVKPEQLGKPGHWNPGGGDSGDCIPPNVDLKLNPRHQLAPPFLAFSPGPALMYHNF